MRATTVRELLFRDVSSRSALFVFFGVLGVAGYRRSDCQSGAVEGHMHEIKAQGETQLLTDEMRWGPGAGGGITQLSRI